jgi:hippurate hydrolase
MKYNLLQGGGNLNVKECIEKNIDTIIRLRNELHENAELSFKEYKTQEIVLNFCRDLGLDIKTLAKTGVSGVLNSADECIAVRADMDALPVNGVSHACGHDYRS